jgi:hypothetical protein
VEERGEAAVKHLVVIERPRERTIYVECKGIDDCLTVVERETEDAPDGTQLTLVRQSPRLQPEPLMVWRKSHGRMYRRAPVPSFTPKASAETRLGYRSNNSRIKLGRSSSNPGEISFELPDEVALYMMGRKFPDVTAENLSQVYGGIDFKDPDIWPLRDSLRYEQIRGGEQDNNPDVYDAWAWWEDRRNQVEMHMVKHDPSYGKVRVDLSGPRYHHERRIYNLTTKQRLRGFDAKSFFIRALRDFVNDAPPRPL